MGTVLRVWWVLLSGAALLAASPAVVRAQEAGLFLPPGLESRFTDILDPLNSLLPESWEWQRATVELDRVDVTFGPVEHKDSPCDQAPICLRLLHPDQGADGDRVSGPFVVRVANLSDPGHLLLAQQLTEQLGKNLEVWATPEEVARTWVEAKPSLHRLSEEEYLQWLLLAAVLGFLVVAILERKALWHPWIPAAFAWTLCVYGVAFWLVPEAPFHDNHHGYSFLSAVQSDTPPVHIVPSSLLVLIKTLGEWFGGSDALFFGVNRVAMALSSVLLGWWVGRVTHSRCSGLLAAGMWGLSPMALRLAGTDSLFNLSVVLFLGAALLLGRSMEWIEQRRWWGLAHAGVAALLVALAGQTHVPALLLVPAALPLAMARAPALATRQRWVVVGAVAATLLLLLPCVVAVLEKALSSDGPTFIEAGNLLMWRSWAQRLLWNSDWVGMAIVPLAFLGTVALVRQWRTVGWWVALAWVVLLLVSLPIATCLHLHAVWETTWVALTTGMAAHGGHVACEWFRARLTGWVAIAARLLCACLVVCSAMQPWEILTMQPPVAQEYLFLKQRVFPYLAESSASQLLVPNCVRTEESPRMPLSLKWGEQQTPGVTWFDTTRAMRQAGPDGAAYVYLGLACVKSHQEAEACATPQDASSVQDLPSLSEYCLRQLRGLTLEPVLCATLPPAPEGLYCVGFPDVPLRVGLFRISAPPLDPAGQSQLPEPWQGCAGKWESATMVAP